MFEIEYELPFIFYKEINDALRCLCGPNNPRNEDVFIKMSENLIKRRKQCVIGFIWDKYIEYFVNCSSDVFYNPVLASKCFLNIATSWPWIVTSELRNEDFNCRYRMVMVIKAIFLQSKLNAKINVAEQLFLKRELGIWDEILARFTDIDSNIRLDCVELASHLLQHESNDELIAGVQEAFASRVNDKRSGIRIKALEVILQIAVIKPRNIILPNLIKNVAARAGDIRPRVRIVALNTIGTIYKLFMNLPHLVPRHYPYKLASACLYIYDAREISIEDMIGIEKCFERYLIGGRGVPVKERALNYLNLISFCDDNAVVAISKIINNQAIIRGMVRDLFDLVIEKRCLIKKTSPQKWKSSQRTWTIKIKMACDEIAAKFPLQFNSIIQFILCDILEEDEELINDLKDIFDNNYVLTLEYMSEIVEKFREKVQNCSLIYHEENDIEQGRFFQLHLLLRSGLFMMERNLLKSILDQMKTFDINYAVRMGALLILISKTYPRFDQETSISELILSMPAQILMVILKMGSNWSEQFRMKLLARVKQYYEC